MQFFNSSQSFWSNSKLPQPVMARPQSAGVTTNGHGAGRKIDCGWYDSSFDLSRGLEVSEQDNDTMYQLWELSRN